MEDKLLQIINNYGVIPQLKYFQSEVFETTEAILEYEFCKKYAPNEAIPDDWWKTLVNHITEEIADVMVMLSQFKEYYHIDGKDIMKIMNEKIDRQLKRIEDGE